jgi:hypothetical protein
MKEELRDSDQNNTELSNLTLVVNKKCGSKLPEEVILQLNDLSLSLPEDIQKFYELLLLGPEKFNTEFLSSDIAYSVYKDIAKSLFLSLKSTSAINALLLKEDPFKDLFYEVESEFKGLIKNASNGLWIVVEECDKVIKAQSKRELFVKSRYRNGERILIDSYLKELKEIFFVNLHRASDFHSRRINRNSIDIKVLLDKNNK